MKKNAGKIQNFFEKILFGSRYLTLAAVIGSILMSALMFIDGTYVIIDSISAFIRKITENQHADEYGLVIVIISSVDKFLVAMVLLIFGMGIYELFISKIDSAYKNKDDRPGWLHVESLDDLKESLGRVILMILIVTFFEKTMHIQFNTSLDLLQLSIGIILIAGALYLSHKSV